MCVCGCVFLKKGKMHTFILQIYALTNEMPVQAQCVLSHPLMKQPFLITNTNL